MIHFLWAVCEGCVAAWLIYVGYELMRTLYWVWRMGVD
jgi:hypothetical protein